MTAPIYKNFLYTLEPGAQLTINRLSDYVTCLASTAPFKIAFDDGPENDFEKGLSLRPGIFQSVRVINGSAAANTIKLGLGKGDLQDNRFITDGAVQVETVPMAKWASGAPVSVPAGGTAQILAADPQRVEGAVRNLDTGNSIWVQDAAVASPEGWQLGALENLLLTTSAAIFVYNPSAAVINVAWFETRRS